ncbi:MAG TPA: hypothetical protein VM146_00640 [Steroidobacteraceae bacterium]|nr:hypothetical protein [Steroidobacteraceae bacterium]
MNFLAVSLTGIVMLAQTASFETGSLPEGWVTGITGSGQARWSVVRDTSAASGSYVLLQSGEATFCWAVDTRARLQDGYVESRIKPESGKEDQAGGLVFRFLDANNYYVVRMNALEGNVVLYKTVDGKRTPLQVRGRMIGYGVDTQVPSGRWNRLRVDFRGSVFRVSFNGEHLFEVEDKVLARSGAVGVWTKADSVTRFDDVSYGSL